MQGARKDGCGVAKVSCRVGLPLEDRRVCWFALCTETHVMTLEPLRPVSNTQLQYYEAALREVFGNLVRDNVVGAWGADAVLAACRAVQFVTCTNRSCVHSVLLLPRLTHRVAPAAGPPAAEGLPHPLPGRGAGRAARRGDSAPEPAIHQGLGGA